MRRYFKYKLKLREKYNKLSNNEEYYSIKIKKIDNQESDEALELINEFRETRTSIENEISLLKTRWLINTAKRLDLPIPQKHANYKMWHNHKVYGHDILSIEGRLHLRNAIRKERRDKWEPIIRYTTILAGLGGVIIGIISTLKN